VAACEFERSAVKARKRRGVAGHVDDDRAGACGRAVGAARKNASDNAAAGGVRRLRWNVRLASDVETSLVRRDDAAHAMRLAPAP